jgi:hypothetical protein
LRRALAAEGFPVADGDMHIVPLIVGDEQDAMRLCQEAIEGGVFAQAIRPPTVPQGTSRLRLAAMASHTASDMRLAASVLGRAARKLGLDPAGMGSPLSQPSDDQTTPEIEEIEQERLAAIAGRTSSRVPFDIERVPGRPWAPRPPAPAAVEAELSQAPFDGERETSIANAA